MIINEIPTTLPTVTFSFHTKILIITVATVPKPDQIAYVMLSGSVLSDRDKNTSDKQKTTSDRTPNSGFENPCAAFKSDVPHSSHIIARTK